MAKNPDASSKKNFDTSLMRKLDNDDMSVASEVFDNDDNHDEFPR